MKMKKWVYWAAFFVILGLFYSFIRMSPSLKVHDSTKTDSQKAQMAVPVETMVVATERVNNRYTTVGTVRAFEHVSVVPLSSGLLNKIYVVAGQKVKVGDPIADLDSVEEKIALDRQKIAFVDAEQTLSRTKQLSKSLTTSRVQEIKAEVNYSNAKLALDAAKLAFDRRTVRSPIDGRVGILAVNVGAYVTTNTAIVEVDNRSKMLVDLYIPERFTAQIHVGTKVSGVSDAVPLREFSGVVTAVDNHLDPVSRTLHIRVAIDNKDDVLRAGMSFEGTIFMPGHVYPSVDPLAIQWSASGAYVWKVEQGKVQKISVRIVQHNVNHILVEGPLKDGDLIVTKGVQNLAEDRAVQVQAESTQDVHAQNNVMTSVTGE